MRLIHFGQQVLAQILATDPFAAVSRWQKPRAPITAGGAGVALFLAELAATKRGVSRRELLNVALLWAKAARRSLRYPYTAYGFENTPFSRVYGGVGVFHGRAGVHLVAARVGDLFGNVGEFRAAAARFVNAWRIGRARNNPPTDVFFGSAGFLHAARDLQNRTSAFDQDVAKSIRLVGSEAYVEVINALSRMAGRPLPNQMPLGYAHGLAGALDAVLHWNPRPHPVVAALLDQLLSHALIEDDLAAWPTHVGQEPFGPFWGSWCNGMPGYVYLWCRAFEVFKDERYLRAARLSAHTTSLLSCQNATVCCGTAGQAFALHRFFRLSNESLYYRLAVERARRACAQATQNGHSLAYFNGLSGIAHLAFTMHSTRTPRLPLIDISTASANCLRVRKGVTSMHAD